MQYFDKNNNFGFFFQLKPMHQQSQTTYAQKNSVRTIFNLALYIYSILYCPENIIVKIILLTFSLCLDGKQFSTFHHYYCKFAYRTENGIANATTKCKKEDKCAMISTLDCSDGESVYSLCEKSTELIPKSEACTLKKKGNEVTLKFLNTIHIYMLNYQKIWQRYIRFFKYFIHRSNLFPKSKPTTIQR